METCYFCNNEATTKEHIPPRSFFAGVKYRERDVIKVQSCAEHNNNKTNDDELFRNIVSFHITGGYRSRELFELKTLKSFQNSPGKLRKLLESAKRTTFKGQITGELHIEYEQLQRYFNMMACGLYFHEFNDKWKPGFHIEPISFRPDSLEWNKARQLDFNLSKNFPKKGAYPETFYYQVLDENKTFVGIRLVFMDNIIFLAYNNDLFSQFLQL